MERSQQRRKYNNGRRHSLETHRLAYLLRAKGYTHRDIATQLGVAIGTAQLWTAKIKLTDHTIRAIEERRVELFRKNWSMSIAQRRKNGKRLARVNMKYSKQDLLKRIRIFYRKHGRIPFKREFDSTVFRRRFGSWNNAILAAGFEPNSEYFAKRVPAKDGHICDSFSEKLIDDWLANHLISHQRNTRYPNTRMTADFFLPDHNIIIEFFGLKGVNSKYDDNLKRKMAIVRSNKWNLISLYKEDIQKKVFASKLANALF